MRATKGFITRVLLRVWLPCCLMSSPYPNCMSCAVYPYVDLAPFSTPLNPEFHSVRRLCSVSLYCDKRQSKEVMKTSLYPPVSLPNLLIAIVLVVTSFILLSATIHRTSHFSSSSPITTAPPPERSWPVVWASYANDSPEPKYFHEAGNTLEMSHYDIRFFQGIIPYSQHREVLQHLIRSYLSIMASLKLETWIAHGTLLGWWWNGRIMPWDYDLDVQVSMSTMEHMAKKFNQTLHEWRYTTDEGGEGVQEIKKTYLLDVNPNYSELKRRQGMNVIDARWVDVDTGMFVDITALAERDPVLEPGIWSCKNFHQYRTHNIWPLKKTSFEGVRAKVPLDHERILVAEYGEKSLVLTEWEEHRWNEELREWVKIPVNGTVNSYGSGKK